MGMLSTPVAPGRRDGRFAEHSGGQPVGRQRLDYRRRTAGHCLDLPGVWKADRLVQLARRVSGDGAGDSQSWPSLWTIYGPRRGGMSHASSDATRLCDRRCRTRQRRGSWLSRHKNLILLTLSYGAVGYFQYLFFYWVHHYFSEVLHVDEDRSRFYAGLPTFAMALGMPLGGWLSDRIFTRFGWRAARSGLGCAAMTASAVLLWIGARAGDPDWSIAWLSLSLGVLGMAEGPFWVTAVEVGGARGGLSAAIFNTGGNGIGLIAPIATPFISDDLGFGWQAGVSVASVVCLAGAACWLWIDQGPQPKVTETMSLASSPASIPRAT